jgi:hypothetical protein
MTPWTRLASFRSQSNPLKKYTVALNDNGTLGCDCPAWKFQKGTKKSCKHLSALLDGSVHGSDVELTPAGVEWALKLVITQVSGS